MTLTLPDPLAAGFAEPDPAIVRAMSAEPLPEARVAPDGRVVALLRQVALPSLRDFGRAIAWIGRWRVDLECPADPQPAVFRSIAFLRTGDGRVIHARLPRTRGIWGLGFSADCTRFAVALLFRRSVRLAIVDVRTGHVRHFRRPGLNARMLVPLFDHHMCRWFGDGRRLLCRTVARAPRNCFRESDMPQVWSATEPSPQAAESHLITALDAKRLQAFCASDLVVVDSESAAVRQLGIRDLITDARPSPDGVYVIVTTLRFTAHPGTLGVVQPDTVTTVWGISRRTPALIQQIERGRLVQWAPHQPSRLTWVEPGTGPAACEVLRWSDEPCGASASAAAVPLDGRCTALRWTSAGRAIVTTEPSPGAPGRRKALLDLDGDGEQDEGALLVSDREPMMFVDGIAGPEVFEKDGAIFVVADGDLQRGESPRLDRVDLRDGSRVQVLAGRLDEYRECVGVLNAAAPSFLTLRESSGLPPRYEVVGANAIERACVLSGEDASRELAACERHLLEYERADGAYLSSVLHVPTTAPVGGRLFPVLCWVYPRLTDTRPAPDARLSMNRFRTARGASPLLMLLRGYAVLVTYTFPLVQRSAGTMDSFIEQMVMNAEASVAALGRAGLTDPARIGIGGHSYGAFLVANLLAHTRLFRAGIARSGAYNRAMTPFGYLNEPRAYWEAVATYTRVSPVSVASRIEAPLLLIHGAWDENEATSPLQSRHLYEALRRVGTPTRYVHLPRECHGFGPAECAQHAVAEMIAWCDRYVAAAPTLQ